MTTLCFFTDENDWNNGELVCVDSSTGKAVKYDSLDPKPVVGSCLKPDPGFSPNSRQWGNGINGIPYYLNDFYVYNEDLTTDFITENSNYSLFNPLTDSGYITAITNGIGAVKNTITIGIPSDWIKMKSGTNYDWYLIR